MYIYKTVLLEIEDKEVLTFEERVVGLMDHLVVIAEITNLRVTEDGLFGDILSFKPLDGLYPSIKYAGSRLLAIGFTMERNIDLSIPPIQ